MTTSTLPRPVREIDAADGLRAIHAPDCAAIVWRRRPDPRVTDWLAALPVASLPRVRTLAAVEALDEVLGAATTSFDDTDMRAALALDCAALARSFAQAMQAPHVRLRLDAIGTDACRRFHVDALTARLVCTYRGTGTQYGHSPARGTDPEAISTLPTGTPIVLRGSLWPPVPDTGLVHRSPRIEGTGETRLLFVVDPIYDLEEARRQETSH
ncbi:MAG: DUF1826 domain-containing protein [Shimia sp.]